ncbi:MAG: DUF167 domain-containing protein [Syntrophales bacterium]|jgi:uncharacterized protein (TIGR00251 family)|nr:DUF167 domain-containing protein [Syntrophales bacterium]MDD5231755.1 DUF167 domain-containing protein [Syntrophales bacterium]MDD5531971.1 DUF167 domain-containing protein [Syntrophales bacterium]HPL63412.1 DUF167 domain-containing protein [Syntrophales bacterium]
MLLIKETADGITFSVRVLPRSSRSGPAGIIDGVLKLKITAPPVEGAANEECVRVIARLLGVNKSRVEIVTGLKSKQKVLRVKGLKRIEAEALLRV